MGTPLRGDLIRGFAARAVLAFLVVAPAALGLWLVGFEISVWGVRPGRGLIVVLVGLSVLAWLRRADVLAEAHKWLGPLTSGHAAGRSVTIGKKTYGLATSGSSNGPKNSRTRA